MAHAITVPDDDDVCVFGEGAELLILLISFHFLVFRLFMNSGRNKGVVLLSQFFADIDFLSIFSCTRRLQ